MPIPDMSDADVQDVSEAVREYLSSARSYGGREKTPSHAQHKLHQLLLHVDAKILALYDLPPRLERELLDVFSGWQRVGVPFKFTEYFPSDFQPCIPLHEYLSSRYRKSTAGELRKKHPGKCPPALLAAMRRADEDFGDDE